MEGEGVDAGWSRKDQIPYLFESKSHSNVNAIENRVRLTIEGGQSKFVGLGEIEHGTVRRLGQLQVHKRGSRCLSENHDFTQSGILRIFFPHYHRRKQGVRVAKLTSVKGSYQRRSRKRREPQSGNESFWQLPRSRPDLR
ncbi:hypothetical protein TNCV_71171 [Trichonephila clavipes]|nr:hypothetical protein TNCV_71171 [Trichonephila clavipes]